MGKTKALITVVSWEERFIHGLRQSLTQYRPDTVVFYMYRGYEERNSSNIEAAREFCKSLNITYKEVYLDFQTPKGNWTTIKTVTSDIVDINCNILLDITTMPRETIWNILFFLEQRRAKIQYVYHRPNGYNKEWLSRDSSEPRLVYKLSGICEISRPTLLFIFPGYDYQRASSLITSFEPHKLIIGRQLDADDINHAICDKCIEDNSGNMITESLDFKAFDDQHGFNEIANKVEENFRSYNIVFGSLGAKLSAIALYRINRMYPETALCYIPCKEFNINYSNGIALDKSVYSDLNIPTRKYDLISEY